MSATSELQVFSKLSSANSTNAYTIALMRAPRYHQFTMGGQGLKPVVPVFMATLRLSTGWGKSAWQFSLHFDTFPAFRILLDWISWD